MEHSSPDMTVEQICTVIDLLNPCIDDHLYVYDFTNDYYHISPHAAERFPIPGTAFHNVIENHRHFVYAPDLAALQTDLNDLIAGRKDFHNMQYRWIDRKGQPVWINCRGYIVHEKNVPHYMIGCINEIGGRQKADDVSGLLGESSLRSYLEDYYAAFPSGYLLRLGLDDFKEINEKFGTEYGDMVLKKTAQCISSCIKPGQMLYRIVADEFVIVDFMGGTVDEACALYVRIRQQLQQFVEDNHYEVVFTISGGILNCADVWEKSYSNIMKISEFALNEAKRNGKNRYNIFTSKDYENFLRKKQITKILRQSILNHFEGFEAYFQPLFHAEDNTLYGAETLMRFHCAELGMISPAEFIPILEETGLIIPAGRWIMRQALACGKKIQRVIPNFQISINVSYIQIMKSDIISEIAAAIEEFEVNPANVVIELTESGLLESDPRFTSLWGSLKSEGIRLALDDFGTGYSNFHYLYELKPDIIKIDRSFTAKALSNEYDYNLLSLMSDMVHHLDLKLCVEGIETEEERIRLQQVGPDYSQGFFFGRPCPYKQFHDDFVAKCSA